MIASFPDPPKGRRYAVAAVSSNPAHKKSVIVHADLSLPEANEHVQFYGIGYRVVVDPAHSRSDPAFEAG